MLQKPTYETKGLILLIRSQEDSSKIMTLEMYCGNSSRTEVMAKTVKEKVVTIVIKINNLGMLRKPTHETMGTII